MTGYQALCKTLKDHIEAMDDGRSKRGRILAEIVVTLGKELGIAEELYQFKDANDATISSDLYDSMQHTDSESSIIVAIEVTPAPSGKQAVYYFVHIAIGMGLRTGTTVFYADGQSLKIDSTSSEFAVKAAKTIARHVVETFGTVLIMSERSAKLWIEDVADYLPQ